MGFLDFVKDIAKPLITSTAGQLFGEGLSRSRATTSYERSEAASAAAFERSKDLYKHRYQYTMQDMLDAGLNPILAVSSGFNVGSPPEMQPAKAPMAAQPIEYFTSGAKNLMDVQKGTRELKRTEAETAELLGRANLNAQKVRESIGQVLKMRQERKLLTQQEKESVARIFQIEADVRVKATQIRKMQMEVNELDARASLEHSERELADSKRKEVKKNIELLNVQISRLGPEIVKIEKLANAYKGKFGTILGFMKAIMESLKVGAGIVGTIPLKK